MGTRLTDFIRVYDYDTSAILSEVSQLEGWRQHGWYNASTGQTSSYQDKELEIRHIDDVPPLQQACADVAIDAARLYAQTTMRHSGITSISHPRLNRYRTGTLMRAHVDHIHSLFDGVQKGIPAITILCALNSDYQGGDLLICGERYDLKAGQVVVFPSCFLYPHEVLEVTDGTRYSFVAWAW